MAPLAAKADGLLVQMRNDAARDVVATTADVTRSRLLLQAAYRNAPLAGGVLTPALEVGVRYDGGDAERGAGLVVGGSLDYGLPAWGLTLTATGKGLLLHQSDGFREWGAGGSLRLDPGAPDRGLALSVAPSWGTATMAAAELWSLPDASRLATPPDHSDIAGRVDAELGYGIDLLDGRALLTPYAGLTVSDAGARTWQLGTRYQLDSSFNVALEGSRNETAAAPEHTLTLSGTLRR